MYRNNNSDYDEVVVMIIMMQQETIQHIPINYSESLNISTGLSLFDIGGFLLCFI